MIPVLAGRSYPLGATVTHEGVNFAIFSQNSTRAELLLFDHPDDPQPSTVIELDPETNRTFYYWHCLVPGLRAGQVYAYRMHGPFDPAHGHRFDGAKVLLDPYAKAIVTSRYERDAAKQSGDNCAQAMRCVVVDNSAYDWEGDQPLRRSRTNGVIYELHVGGFTANSNSGVSTDKRGTFLGLIDKIPYLIELGVSAVELMPVQQFDSADAPAGLTNYWGYSPVAFFAPHTGYAVHQDPLAVVDEFRDMVKALHRAGIEVILDVVFNHTAESDEHGPTLSLRGLENVAYYIPGDKPSSYANYSGCGNTLNANHSIIRRMIMECLRYWVIEMHVDGFRFDLASAMARGEFGEPLYSPPTLWTIESDPVLAGTRMIAEAWDAGGLYQVGSFIGDRFAEWNGHFRDDVRRFCRGDSDVVLKLAYRIVGSPDLYPKPNREVARSVNFVACHDGFTLNDLVSYDHKHNENNGQENQDGSSDNYSWNCGEEGPTNDPAIEALRQRQIKNLLTILMLSQGTPMLLMGDEVRRTQGGNNNGYAHDDERNWFDWQKANDHGDLLRFVRELIALRSNLVILHETFYPSVGFIDTRPSVLFHGVDLQKPDMRANSHSLAFTLHHAHASEMVHVILNGFWEPLSFELPLLARGNAWRRIVYTSQPAPNDICRLASAPVVSTTRIEVTPRSCVVLMAQH